MKLRHALAAVALIAAVATSLGGIAAATVPPKNCGALKVGSKNYTIKADQLKCSTAKTDARAYLASHRKPKGFTCRDFKGSKMAFRCSQGIKVFFAIRR